MSMDVHTHRLVGFRPDPDTPREGEVHRQIVATGGTIDSVWDPKTDSIVPSSRSVIPAYLGTAVRDRDGWDLSEVCMKDSRTLEPADRERAIDEVVGSMHQAALVTVGTYAMPDLAQQLNRSDAFEAVRAERRAVFTGALVPILGFSESDGGFNLGMSKAGLDFLSAGDVAVCMNGRLIMAGDVAKDTNATVFTPSHPRYNRWQQFDRFDLITAGGSIDFTYDYMDGLVPADHSGVPDFLRKTNLAQRVLHTSTSRLLDSRKLEDPDLDEIVGRVESSQTGKVLLTMGLYGMERVKEVLEARPEAIQGKTIILTGSRIPLKAIERSDAPYNLGFAIGKLASTPPGVYIALGGILLGESDCVSDLFTASEREKIAAQRIPN